MSRRWLVVTGGRDYRDYVRFSSKIEEVVGLYKIDHIAHGGASGADWMTSRWFHEKGSEYGIQDCVRFEARWKELGRAAGPLRNKRMLEATRPCLVLAFPGGRGTANCIQCALGMGLQVQEVKE